jgi:hypothetical protein
MLPVAQSTQYMILWSPTVENVRLVIVPFTGFDLWETLDFNSFRKSCTIMTRQISSAAKTKEFATRNKVIPIMTCKPSVFKDAVSISKLRLTSGTCHSRLPATATAIGFGFQQGEGETEQSFSTM